MNQDEFIAQLIRHEGLELKPYTDTVGKLTIGVGRNLTDNGITNEEAMLLLDNDLAKHGIELSKQYPVVGGLEPVRFFVLVNMAFNLGMPRLSKFKKMWRCIHNDDYVGASIEMLDSRWATQVGGRAVELSEMMKTGKYEWSHST